MEGWIAKNVALDSVLLALALEVSEETTNQAVVTRALREFVARRKRSHLLDLFNRLKWDSAYRFKAERSRR